MTDDYDLDDLISDMFTEEADIEPEPINIRDLLPAAAEAYINAKIEPAATIEVEIETETPDYFAIMAWEMLSNSCPALSTVDALEKYNAPDINEFHFRMHCSSMIIVARKVSEDGTFWWDFISYSFVDETDHSR